MTRVETLSGLGLRSLAQLSKTRGKFSVIFDWVCLFVQVHFLPTTIKEVPAEKNTNENIKSLYGKEEIREIDAISGIVSWSGFYAMQRPSLLVKRLCCFCETENIERLQ